MFCSSLKGNRCINVISFITCPRTTHKCEDFCGTLCIDEWGEKYGEIRETCITIKDDTHQLLIFHYSTYTYIEFMIYDRRNHLCKFLQGASNIWAFPSVVRVHPKFKNSYFLLANFNILRNLRSPLFLITFYYSIKVFKIIIGFPLRPLNVQNSSFYK